MKHDSSARRKIHPVCLPPQAPAFGDERQAPRVPLEMDHAPLRGKIHLVDKDQSAPAMKAKKGIGSVLAPEAFKPLPSRALTPEPNRVDRWLYASDVYAIPLCLLWIIAYSLYSSHAFTRIDLAGPAHFVGTVFNMVEMIVRFGESVLHWVMRA